MKVIIDEVVGGWIVNLDDQVRVYDSTRLNEMFVEIIKKAYNKRVKVVDN